MFGEHVGLGFSPRTKPFEVKQLVGAQDHLDTDGHHMILQ